MCIDDFQKYKGQERNKESLRKHEVDREIIEFGR